MTKNTVLMILLACTLAGCAFTQQGAMSSAHSSYGKEKFKDCLNHLYRAEHYGSFSDSADAEIALQKGLCLEGVGRKSEALAVYHHLILKYPKSDLVPQAWARIEQ